MNPKLFFSSLLFSGILFSCNHSAKQQEILDTTLSKIELNGPSIQDNKENKKHPPPTYDLKGDTITAPVPPQPAAHTDWDKKIIKTATVKLEVKDFKKYNDIINTIIRQSGGYIAREQQNLTDEKLEISLSIKVPVEQFETTMNELAPGDIKVLERMITSQDVTGEVIDTKLRLEAKKQMRLKYLDFLKASKNIEEALKVQTEINDMQEEIEAAAGRVEYLSHQSAFSTINLTFYQPVNGYQPIDTTPAFLTRVSNSFKLGAEWITDLLVALISIWPLLLITLGAVFIFKRMKYLKTNPQKS